MLGTEGKSLSLERPHLSSLNSIHIKLQHQEHILYRNQEKKWVKV